MNTQSPTTPINTDFLGVLDSSGSTPPCPPYTITTSGADPNGNYRVVYTREEYEKDLKRRQQEHLANIKRQGEAEWQPCLHDQCSQCIGTGVKSNGEPCIHGGIFTSCRCPRCSPH